MGGKMIPGKYSGKGNLKEQGSMYKFIWPKDEKKATREVKNRYDSKVTLLQNTFCHFSGKHSLFILSLLYSVEQFICIELIQPRNVKSF